MNDPLAWKVDLGDRCPTYFNFQREIRESGAPPVAGGCAMLSRLPLLGTSLEMCDIGQTTVRGQNVGNSYITSKAIETILAWTKRSDAASRLCRTLRPVTSRQ